MSISDEAVKVIAKALNELVGGRSENWFVWLEDAKAALEAALPILRAQFAEEVAVAWDGDRDLYHLIEDRMLASGGHDADAVQDIGTTWLRNLGAK